jgi:hypothetical protein
LIVERTVRVTTPSGITDKAMVGSTIWARWARSKVQPVEFSGPIPIGGRAPSSTAKMMTSTIASQKWGTLTPISEIRVTSRSTMRDLA